MADIKDPNKPHDPKASASPSKPDPLDKSAAPKHSAPRHSYNDKDDPNAAMMRRNHDAKAAQLEQELKNEEEQFEAYEKLDVSALAGDLGHGEKGYLILDSLGMPTGAASIEPPPPGTPAANVVGYFPVAMDELVTPSGAPIRPFMNPMPDPRDPGMEARIKESLSSAGQPVDEHGSLKERASHAQPGSPVVNTPGRV